jgi:hypothetical protein
MRHGLQRVACLALVEPAASPKLPIHHGLLLLVLYLMLMLSHRSLLGLRLEHGAADMAKHLALHLLPLFVTLPPLLLLHQHELPYRVVPATTSSDSKPARLLLHRTNLTPLTLQLGKCSAMSLFSARNMCDATIVTRH